MKKTPWFLVKDRPTRNGLYECRYYDSHVVCIRRFEDGGWFTPEGYLTAYGFSENDQWRGLTEQAKDQT